VADRRNREVLASKRPSLRSELGDRERGDSGDRAASRSWRAVATTSISEGRGVNRALGEWSGREAAAAFTAQLRRARRACRRAMVVVVRPWRLRLALDAPAAWRTARTVSGSTGCGDRVVDADRTRSAGRVRIDRRLGRARAELARIRDEQKEREGQRQEI